MTVIDLPKPEFSASDETSISLTCKFPSTDIAMKTISENRVRLQYKQPHEPWDQAKSVSMSLMKGDGKHSSASSVEVCLSSVCVEDLNPGTPYCVRFVIVDTSSTIIQIGPDTVYDTSPVDCGPKKKSCLIS